MPTEDHFTDLKNKIDEELNLFFDNKIKQIKNQEKPDELLEMTESLRDFILRSGKRIRPILFYRGYIIAGGKDKERILKAAISVELIHSFLLIHDDIIDQDNFRHGNLSMHCRYKEKYKNKSSKHFEISMAIIVGDLAHNFGYEVLSKLDFLLDLKIKAIDKMNQIVSNTIAGEATDVMLSVNSDFDINKIIEMQKYKTAQYTIEGPLHLGAILAGADEKFLKLLSEFSIPLGIAFQIQDDIIGIFGDEKKTGKPVGSDIKEGKKTLLIAKALEVANKKQKDIILTASGNKKLNLDDIENVKKIIKETGSLEYSKAQTEKLIKLSKKHLKKIKASSKCKEFLSNLADFIIKREY
ncbi:polyprenyl synthetase family protein [Candidatus Parcubacteria bacterium]|nr:polyprenyl synthetase family protein [Candidatus Parcubacteria bacterium]